MNGLSDANFGFGDHFVSGRRGRGVIEEYYSRKVKREETKPMALPRRKK